MRLVCISDTHNRHRELSVPEGDLLVHAGDATRKGTLPEIEDFLAWLWEQPHRHKVFVAGNHDFLCDQVPDAFQLGVRGLPLILPPGVTYLRDSQAEFDGLRVYGSPWQSDAPDWAFWLPRGSEAMAKRRAQVPDGLDLLVTHAPPLGIHDLGTATQGYEDAHFGCPMLLEAVGRVKPRVHVFGHTHRGYGRTHRNGTTFVNAVISPRSDQPLNEPIVLDL